MRATPIPDASRRLVEWRDRHRCARCGGLGTEWHHRRSRSVRDEMTHSPCNGVLMCKTDHDWAHANPLLAQADGFIVSRYRNPRTEPISHRIFGRVLLTEEGNYEPIGATDDRTNDHEG